MENVKTCQWEDFSSMLNGIAESALNFILATLNNQNATKFDFDVEKFNEVIRNCGCKITDFFGVEEVLGCPEE